MWMNVAMIRPNVLMMSTVPILWDHFTVEVSKTIFTSQGFMMIHLSSVQLNPPRVEEGREADHKPLASKDRVSHVIWNRDLLLIYSKTW